MELPEKLLLISRQMICRQKNWHHILNELKGKYHHIQSILSKRWKTGLKSNILIPCWRPYTKFNVNTELKNLKGASPCIVHQSWGGVPPQCYRTMLCRYFGDLKSFFTFQYIIRSSSQLYFLLNKRYSYSNNFTWFSVLFAVYSDIVGFSWSKSVVYRKLLIQCHVTVQLLRMLHVWGNSLFSKCQFFSNILIDSIVAYWPIDVKVGLARCQPQG